MKAGQTLWTREELILAINLYCKLPFGRLHKGNPEIIHLAKLIHRTPSAVALKLVNFASFDPSLRARGIKGASNASKLDSQIWNEFYSDWETLAFESEKLLKKYDPSIVMLPAKDDFSVIERIGSTRERIVKTRVNQDFFRKMILASYNNTCCITGLNIPELLVAGHIIPWSKDEKNRLNPRNGIAINALHDRAYELGYLTIMPDYTIKIASSLKKDNSLRNRELFLQYNENAIILPSRFLPDPDILKYHNEKCFLG